MAVHFEFKAKHNSGRALEKGNDSSSNLAAWLKQRLDDSGLTTSGPTRYDWGFEIPIRAKGAEYFAGLPSRKDATSNWHIFLEKRRSIRDRLRGSTMPTTEPMALLIREIIARDPQFKVVRVEEEH